MATKAQPAKKSYFFEKGYVDLRNTIKGAWKGNFYHIANYKRDIADIYKVTTFNYLKIVDFIVRILIPISGIVSVLVVGSIVTLVMSAVNIVILLVVMVIVYIGFSITWLVDRMYLINKKIFTACHECKEKSLIPTYICPKCGAKHTNLTPGVYGILYRTCVGESEDSSCGFILPTTFFNGRKNLNAICPKCSTSLMDRESVPICIPVVGGRSVGKTAFITAFSKEFIDSVAPKKLWDIEFYNNKKKEIYEEIELDYLLGSTRMTNRQSDINKASSTSFSFFIKSKEFSPERLVHIYDIAGEVFTDNNENEIQQQYKYCHGMVLMIDPFSIPSVRHRCENRLKAKDIAGIGKADINEIIDSFINKLREVTGLSDKKISSVPLAVIIGKIDSAGLSKEVGDEAVKQLMAQQPKIFKDYYDTQDYVCRKFLIDNGMGNFINNVDMKFKVNRYFSCSAIGHTRDKGKYNPQGVLPPMEWIFSKADSKIASSWNDIKFSKKVPITVKNANV